MHSLTIITWLSPKVLLSNTILLLLVIEISNKKIYLLSNFLGMLLDVQTLVDQILYKGEQLLFHFPYTYIL